MEEKTNRMRNLHALVVGLGGVGDATEMICWAGVGVN